MGCIGKEIVQSRIWVKSDPDPIPELNYKETFPITVFNAIRETYDENSCTLKMVVDDLYAELYKRQMILPAKPANYLVTYGGIAGQVGAIQISQKIPWDSNEQRTDRIPTEKAVGDLLSRLGFVDEDGNVDPDATRKIHWSEIIGRPNVYYELGDNQDGFVVQKVIKDVIRGIQDETTEKLESQDNRIAMMDDRVSNHIRDYNNPHQVSVDQIGAVSKDVFDAHVLNDINPHHITKEMIGLENVDNTSDIDKPISKATQEALDALKVLLDKASGDVFNVQYLTNIKYHQKSGKLEIVYSNGDIVTFDIPIEGLIDEINYEQDKKRLAVYELGGHVSYVDLHDLYVRYFGSVNTHIDITIDGENLIHANIRPETITNRELANDAVWTRILKDQSVTAAKIKDLTITTVKLANHSITTEKINRNAIINELIADHSVDGRTLFRSDISNRVLGTLERGKDPVWTQVVSDMLGDSSVSTRSIQDKSVTNEKLADLTITGDKIKDGTITKEKLADGIVGNDTIINNTIEGNKIVENVHLPGTPSISTSPSEDSNNNEVPTTQWVKHAITTTIINNNNITNNTINQLKLTPSNVGNRVLVTHLANSKVEWGQVNHDMISKDSIGEDQLIDDSVTSNKIGYKAVLQEHLSEKIIATRHLENEAITPMKIFKSNAPNRVLGVGNEGLYPQYTLVYKDMLANNSVGTWQIEDGSVTPEKMTSSAESQRVLATMIKGTTPAWVQVSNGMIGDKAIDGRTLFSSPFHNTILAVTTPGDDPAWLKVTSEMIEERNIKRENIGFGEVWHEHIHEKSISSEQIMDDAIQSSNIAANAITGKELFTSETPNRVLAVTAEPYSDPAWLQVTTDMIEDKAITKEKMFQSELAYRVLGVTQPNVPPEYIKINSNFIVDYSIIPEKLVRNFTLFGTPSITTDPRPDADNFQIPSTRWVRALVKSMGGSGTGSSTPGYADTGIEEVLLPEKETITGDHIVDFSIPARKLVREPFVDESFLSDGCVTSDKLADNSVRENHIHQGAVTSEKIHDDVTLHGAPTVSLTEPEKKSLRNITISDQPPTGGEDGDIWFQYI